MKNVKSGHAKPIVCLDAGHYGKYNRSPAVKSYYESDMTWKLHLMLKEELEESYGIQVKLTRTAQEKDKDLYSRGKESKDCDLFLSIHSNAVGSKVNESVDYPVVYVQLDGKGDKLGKALADAIQETMGTKQAGCISSRKGNRGEYYGVLRGAAAVGTMGLIVEHSFHTQTKATKWLLDDSNLKKMAQVEAAIIADWFGMKKPESTGTVSKYYRVRKSWKDAGSQLGAYTDLNNAIANCPKGYSVFDWNGDVVYGAAKPDANSVKPYRVKITTSSLNVRDGAGTSYKVNTTVRKGEIYTIVAEKGNWGKLKSGAGWISLKYCSKL